MAHVCFAKEIYKEALEHYELAESLGGASVVYDAAGDGEDGHVRQLLTKAKMQYLANKPCEGAVTADRAWELYLDRGGSWECSLWSGFLGIFLELRQPHRLRPSFLNSHHHVSKNILALEHHQLRKRNGAFRGH
ncbi:hypothetical protein BDW74DRAFT_66436 [Aspergillus multicolor]|uniref:uncharacterized protein n=1 Tax=Aspergillus multicolor TaxID=41759 RepID=UPI003CCE1E28